LTYRLILRLNYYYNINIELQRINTNILSVLNKVQIVIFSISEVCSVVGHVLCSFFIVSTDIHFLPVYVFSSSVFSPCIL
jgi:hypothetical protein